MFGRPDLGWNKRVEYERPTEPIGLGNIAGLLDELIEPIIGDGIGANRDATDRSSRSGDSPSIASRGVRVPTSPRPRGGGTKRSGIDLVDLRMAVAEAIDGGPSILCLPGQQQHAAVRSGTCGADGCPPWCGSWSIVIIWRVLPTLDRRLFGRLPIPVRMRSGFLLGPGPVDIADVIENAGAVKVVAHQSRCSVGVPR